MKDGRRARYHQSRSGGGTMRDVYGMNLFADVARFHLNALVDDVE
ncbi:hypothetical protein ACX80Z_15790 [Arthrobacter sp. TMT4-20]